MAALLGASAPPAAALRAFHAAGALRPARRRGGRSRSAIALEDIAAFFADLGRRTGASFDAGSRANQDFAFRFKASERWLWRANQALKEVLPYAAYQGVKRRVKPLLVREKPAMVEDVFTSAEVRGFVREVYAADIALHKEDLRATA